MEWMSGNEDKPWSGCLGNETNPWSGCLGMRLSHGVDVWE